MDLQFHPDPEDGQRNRPKQVQFQTKNKFEKLVHLIGFIIRNIPCISVYERPDDGSKLQPKHVAVNKLIKNWYCVQLI
jgi:hypothetical protein